MRTVINNTEDELYHDSTLFICNKWETVPDKYKEEVRIDTMRKLQKFFSSITEDQLFFMSVSEVKIKKRKFLFFDFVIITNYSQMFNLSKMVLLRVHFHIVLQGPKALRYSW